MADRKVSELSDGTPSDSSLVYLVSDALVSVKTTLADLYTYIKNKLDVDTVTPSAHASTHEDGGSDEIDVTGLSGELADPQLPKIHASTHVDGTDDIQLATAVQKGLMSSAYASKLDGIEAGADVTDEANVQAAGAVMTTGDQSVNGVKSFGSFPVTPAAAPTADYQVANKKYVDDHASTSAAHASTHEDGGSDEINVAGLSGKLADAQTPEAHASTHYDGGADTIPDATTTTDGLMSSADKTKLDGIEAGADVTDATNVEAAGAVMTSGDQTVNGVKTFGSFPVTPSASPTTDYQVANKKYVDDQAGVPGAHASTHEDGGSDEIDVTGLSGELADPQNPKTHAATHADGTDDIQLATSTQKGLMSSAYASKLDGIEAGADVTDAGNVSAAGAVMKSIADAKGDLLVASADDAISRLPVGTDGQVLTADSAEVLGVKWAAASSGGGGSGAKAIFRNVRLHRLNVSQIIIEAGTEVGADDNSIIIEVDSDITVTITISGANGLDDGTEQSTAWYYVYLISNDDGSTVAGLLSLSSTSPKMPSGYTKKRLIGAIRNHSGDILEFKQIGRRYRVGKITLASYGNGATPTSWTAVSCNDVAPPDIAESIQVIATSYRSSGSSYDHIFIGSDTYDRELHIYLNSTTAAIAGNEAGFVMLDDSNNIYIRHGGGSGNPNLNVWGVGYMMEEK